MIFSSVIKLKISKMKVSLSILLAVSSVAVANPAARVSNMKILIEHYYIHISYYVLMFYNIYINRQWRHSQWGPRGPDPTKISEADFKYFVQ